MHFVCGQEIAIRSAPVAFDRHACLRLSRQLLATRKRVRNGLLGSAAHSAARSIMPGPEVNHEHRNYPLSHQP